MSKGDFNDCFKYNKNSLKNGLEGPQMFLPIVWQLLYYVLLEGRPHGLDGGPHRPGLSPSIVWELL